MRTLLIKHLKIAMAGKTSNVEAPAHDLEGNEVWYDTTFVPVLDKDGRVKYVIAASVDITERRQAEKELRESEKRYRALFESTTDAIMLLDDHAFFDCNEAALRMFGCASRNDFLNRHPAELSPPTQPCGTDSKDLADEHIAVTFRQGSNRFEWTHKRIGGTEFPAEVLLTTIKLDGKKVLQATVRDITRRRQTEKDLLEEEQRARQVIDTARDAFVNMDADDIITDWNPRAEEMFGWSRDEALGKKATETFIPEESREAHTKSLERYLAAGEGPVLNQHIEFTARHRDSHTFPVELSIVPVRSNDIVSFNAFIRDISERHKAKETLEKSHEQLRASLIGTITAVSRAVGARDPYTAGHQPWALTGIDPLLLIGTNPLHAQ